MYQRLILIWHRLSVARPHVSSLYCSPQASRPLRTDSSAKQKSIGLLADGWGAAPSQTLSLCSGPVRHPSCEWTHCARSVSLWELSTSTHYVWRRHKAHYEDRWTQAAFWSSEETDLGLFLLFLFKSPKTFVGPTVLYRTKATVFVALVSYDYDASPGLCFSAITIVSDKAWWKCLVLITFANMQTFQSN